MLRVLALVAFVGLVAGATALAYDAIERRGLPAQVDPVVENRTTSPGHDVAFPVVVRSAQETPVDLAPSVSAPEGMTASVPGPVTAPTGNGTGFWVTVTVGPDAPTGTDDVRLTLAGGGASRVVTLPVTVEEPDEVIQQGETAEVDYVGRFPNGTLFATNVADIAESSLPRNPRFATSQGILQVPTGPDASFIEGFKEGVVGVGVGHDVTLTLPPAKAYGNETVTEERSRTEEIDRTRWDRRVFEVSRDAAEQRNYVNASSEEGDIVNVASRAFEITHLNVTHVELTWALEKGDRFTHIQAWPNSSVAQEFNETHVRFRIQPPEDGGPYTWHRHWPNATTIESVDSETLTIEHTPEVGVTWTEQVGRRSAQHEVTEVRTEAIVVERENTAPFAGETLIFDVSVQGKAN
jgi:FKBP-type peptidyl-prolyl cis-trans isomerase 2